MRSAGLSSPISSVEITAAFKPFSSAVFPRILVVVRLPHSWEVPPTKTTGALGLYVIFGSTSVHWEGAVPNIFLITSKRELISFIITPFDSANFNNDLFSKSDNDRNDVITFSSLSIA